MKRNKLIILFSTVGILSIVIFLIMNQNLNYYKNVEIKIGEEKFKDYSIEDKNINLESVNKFTGILGDLEFVDNKLLMTNVNDGYILNNHTGGILEYKVDYAEIKIFDYKKNKVDNIITSVKNNKSVDANVYLSNLGKKVIYSIIDHEKNNTTSYLYDFKSKIHRTLDDNLKILAWYPDDSGFLALKDRNIIYYDVKKEESKITNTLNEDIYINSMKFSKDGTRVYIDLNKIMNNQKINTLEVYNQKEGSRKILKELSSNDDSWIVEFDIIDNNNIIINQYIKGKEKLGVYNIDDNMGNIVSDITKVQSMYTNKDKDKLVIIKKDKYPNTIELYDIKGVNGDLNVSKIDEINNIQGIIQSITINENELAYSTYDYKNNQSMVYVYEILN